MWNLTESEYSRVYNAILERGYNAEYSTWWVIEETTYGWIVELEYEGCEPFVFEVYR